MLSKPGIDSAMMNEMEVLKKTQELGVSGLPLPVTKRPELWSVLALRRHSLPDDVVRLCVLCQVARLAQQA